MDLNRGAIIDDASTVAEMGRRMFELVLAAASGARNKSVLHVHGRNEFVP